MSNVLVSHTYPTGQVLEIVQGDITAETVDAIINAANSRLQHGGGVAWAISQKGGPTIQKESDDWVRQYGSVHHDQPAYTSGGKLPCKYVIHAVGPVWGEGNEDAKLSIAVTSSFRRANELGLRSIALPAISTGIFGFPKARAAGVIFSAIAGYFNGHPESGISLVRLVLYDTPTIEAFVTTWGKR